MVMRHQNIGFPEALELIARELGFGEHTPLKTEPGKSETKDAPPVLETSPLDKNYSHKDGIAIPMYANDGTVSGWVLYGTDGSKRLETGCKSGIVGINAWDALMSKCPAKIVFKTAGVSDCLVLNGLIADSRYSDSIFFFAIR